MIGFERCEFNRLIGGCPIGAGESMFVCARFYGLLVRWLTTTADHGRSQRDDESCSQASTYLRAGRYLLCENIKRALSVAPWYENLPYC